MKFLHGPLQLLEFLLLFIALWWTEIGVIKNMRSRGKCPVLQNQVWYYSTVGSGSVCFYLFNSDLHFCHLV